MNTRELEKKYIFQTYNRFPLEIVKGRGKYLWDVNGKKYLDFFTGLSVCNIGHCNPEVVRAIKKQCGELIHVSNVYYTKPQVELACALVRNSFDGQVFFQNSGAEAMECAIKLVRKYFSGSGRHEIITFTNSFHGRTLAALSATGQKKFHKGFEPLLEGFRTAEFNHIESVKKCINKKTAAVVIEPVQGEGGVYPAKKEFLQTLQKVCVQNGLLLIFDEVQTGLGRTGEMFAFKSFGVKPDVLVIAKSLGGGLPIGAVIAKRNISNAFKHGDHGSTFGGNPVVCAAAIETLKFITPVILAEVRETGRYFREKLESLAAGHSFVKEVRGMGLMLGLQLDIPGRQIVEACRKKACLLIAPRIRF